MIEEVKKIFIAKGKAIEENTLHKTSSIPLFLCLFYIQFQKLCVSEQRNTRFATSAGPVFKKITLRLCDHFWWDTLYLQKEN